MDVSEHIAECIFLHAMHKFGMVGYGLGEHPADTEHLPEHEMPRLHRRYDDLGDAV